MHLGGNFARCMGRGGLSLRSNEEHALEAGVQHMGTGGAQWGAACSNYKGLGVGEGVHYKGMGGEGRCRVQVLAEERRRK